VSFTAKVNETSYPMKVGFLRLKAIVFCS
jgi:hypothetical protein